MKKISILGIALRDYTLREALRQVEGYLKNGALNTVICMTTQMLVKAGEDPEQKEWLESMDMAVFCEPDILRAAGITGWNRIKEVENNSLLKEIFKRLSRGRCSVFLVAGTPEEVEILEKGIMELSDSLKIAGKSVLEQSENGVNADKFINEVNDVVPTAVISLLPYPFQEEFIFSNRDRINSNLWLGLRKEIRDTSENGKGFRSLSRKIQHVIFQKKVHKYNKEKTE